MDHFDFMKLAIEEAYKCESEEGRINPKVGVVVVKDGVVLATAYRGEVGKGLHAEYIALEKKLANVSIVGATVYTTLEPCTSRSHPKVPLPVRRNTPSGRSVYHRLPGMVDAIKLIKSRAGGWNDVRIRTVWQ